MTQRELTFLGAIVEAAESDFLLFTGMRAQ